MKKKKNKKKEGKHNTSTVFQSGTKGIQTTELRVEYFDNSGYGRRRTRRRPERIAILHRRARAYHQYYIALRDRVKRFR